MPLHRHEGHGNGLLWRCLLGALHFSNSFYFLFCLCFLVLIAGILRTPAPACPWGGGGSPVSSFGPRAVVEDRRALKLPVRHHTGCVLKASSLLPHACTPEASAHHTAQLQGTCRSCFSHSNLQLAFLPRQQLALHLWTLTCSQSNAPTIRGRCPHLWYPLISLSASFPQNTPTNQYLFTSNIHGHCIRLANSLCPSGTVVHGVKISIQQPCHSDGLCVCTCVYLCVLVHLYRGCMHV